MTRSDGKPLLVLLDGHAMVYRAFYAIQNPMTVSTTGEEVRGVYGFLNTFLRNLSDLEPTHCAIAFDLSGPTFRHAQYDEYKATRPPMPPELRQQVERVREIMHAFRIPVLEREGIRGRRRAGDPVPEGRGAGRRHGGAHGRHGRAAAGVGPGARAAQLQRAAHDDVRRGEGEGAVRRARAGGRRRTSRRCRATRRTTFPACLVWAPRRPSSC